MNRTARALLGWLLLLAVFAGGVDAQEGKTPKPASAKSKIVAWARGYLLEVKKHLKTSFVNCDQVTDAGLVAACVQGLDRALKADVHKGLDPDAVAALHELFAAKYEKISEVMSALDGFLAENPVAGLKVRTLADSAAKAMVESIHDPYSHIFTSAEIEKMMKMLSGQERDDNLGLSVAPKGGRFEVGYVMYGTPAYWAGLQMGDQVLSINDTAIEQLTLPQIAESVKVKPGASMTITLRREGWVKPYTFTLVQDGSKAGDVLFKVLPGDIGYLRLTIFDMTLDSSVRQAMDQMVAKGIRSLILDLRQNPGGALNAAVAVADQFIPGKALITKTESNYKVELPFNIPGLVPDLAAEFHARKKSPFEKLPMVVLIDHSSASASELLSGALQDTKRATLIGETSYGKGVGQTVIPLWKTGFPAAQRYLYLTVMRYTLPTGRSIHGIGVEPNVVVAAPKPTGEEFDRLWTLRRGGKLEAYVEAAFAKQPALKSELANYDGFDTSRYPGFDGFYQGLKTKLSAQQVRDEVRRVLRRQVEREAGAPLVFDLETDAQLQEAVLELADHGAGGGH